MKESEIGLDPCGCSKCDRGLHESSASSRFLKKQMKKLRRCKLEKYYTEHLDGDNIRSHSYYNW